jgi:LPXTG-motif cell wall-anchored protein
MRTSITRHSALVAATLLATIGLAFLAPSIAGAQTTCDLPAAYQGSATFSASVTSATPGSTIVFTGSGWPANSTIAISVNGASVGTATTNGSGQFSFSYTVPSSATGTLTVTAGCGAFVLSQSVSVGSGGTVTPISTGTTGQLPVTGSQSIGTAQVALALLAAGGLLVLLARRRTTVDA